MITTCMECIQISKEDLNFPLFGQVLETIYPPEQVIFKSGESIPEQHLHTCLVIKDRDKPVARAALYFNPDLKYKGHRAAGIGLVESIHDTAAFEFLISRAASLAGENDFSYLIGPMNGSTWEAYRFNFENYFPLFFTEQLQQEYYNDLMVQTGFETISEYFSSFTYDVAFRFPEFEALNRHFLDLGVQVSPILPQHYLDELPALYEFLSAAFQRNFLYTPVSKEQFIHKYSEFLPLVDPDYVLKANDAEGKLIGIYFCIPDVYNASEKTLIIKSAARDPDPEWRGLGHWIGQHIYDNALKNGFEKIIHAFMKTDGTSNTISQNFLGKPFKQYRLYGKEIL